MSTSTHHSFSSALDALRQGQKDGSHVQISRSGWNGRGMFLQLQVPDNLSKMTLPYIYLKTAHDDLVPWLASQTDLLSDDWEIHQLHQVPA